MTVRLLLAVLLLGPAWKAMGDESFPNSPLRLLATLNAPHLATPLQITRPEHVDLLLEAIFLKLEEPPPADRATIAGLIPELGNPHYRIREETSMRLATHGSLALAQLEEARHHSDPEISVRARELVATARAELAASTELDGNHVNRHLRTLLGLVNQPELLTRLAAGLRNRMTRHSVHELHDFLAIPVIDRILHSRDDAIINLMHPILDGPNRDLARSLAMRLRSKDGERLAHLPDLLLQALRDDDPELVQVVLSSPLFPPRQDPRRAELHVILCELLEKPYSEPARLNAARTLFSEFQDPRGARFLADRAGTEHRTVVANALSAPTFIGQPVARELVDILAPLRFDPHHEVRRATVGFLLTRSEKKHRKLGIEIIPVLTEEELHQLAATVSYLISTHTLRAEILETLPDDPNAITLLGELPAGNGFKLHRFGLRDAPAELPPAFRFR